MMTSIAAYLLIVTALYTGSMTSGASVEVRFETRTKSEAVCAAVEQSIKRTLRYQGATRIRGKCVKQ